MRGYSTMSDEERNSILQQHSAFYNGYATGNIPSGPQPLLQDEGPSDSQGITVNNRGEVGQYKNHLVNESVVSEEDKDWIQKVDMDKGSFTEYCGGEVTCDCVEKARKEGGKPEKQAQLFLNMNSEKCKSLQEEVKEYAADDMDVSDVESAYDFESGGPEQFDDSTTDISDSYGMDIDSIMQMFGGEMSAAEYDDVDSDMNQDLDGKEKYSGEMGAYNFNSDGSMDGETYEEVDEEDVCEGCGETYEEVDEEDVCEGCGETYEDVDEDLMEDFIKQKERIVEMFDRFKKFI
jgi:predicted Fe-S protein YdhL (DUF1289 family)